MTEANSVHECGECGGVYKDTDLERHANNAHGVAIEEIEFTLVEEFA